MLFSLTTIVANENVTADAYLDSDVNSNSISVADDFDGLESQTILNDDSLGEDGVDLSVRLDFENVKVDNNYNPEGSKFPWTVTVKVTGGTAKDVKVHETFSNNIEYFSHNSTIGEYDPATGIWDIGDLSSSDTAYLTIFTKVLSTEGKLNNTVDATTASNDVDLSNNHAYLYAKSTGGKVTSNTTETSDDRKGFNSQDHFQSHENDFVDRINEKQANDVNRNQRNSNDDGSGDNSKKDSDSKSISSKLKSSSAKNNPSPLSKSTKSGVDTLSNAIRSIIDSDSNSDEKNSENPSKDVVKSILPYDYTRMPLIIFSVFIVLLLCIVAYDKVKS